MSDQNTTLRDEIAFVRAMAEDGRRTSLRGGPVMIASGLIFGTASLAIWVGLETGYGTPGQLNLVWPISAVLFFVCLFFFLRNLPKGEKQANTFGMAWSGLGWAIFVCVLSLIMIAVRTNQAAAAAAISPVILSFYGAAWCIAGAMARKRWPYGFGLASFAAALLNAWVVPNGDLMFLIYAISLYALVAAPGVLLTRMGKAA
ncbi:MAG TPA: hypothetical protein VHV27_06665 [Phenylobacterium sp.]|nr:hypothetical protein [Phenylobacterium sp.]